MQAVAFLPLALIFAIFSSGTCEDTVAEDLGQHQLERLVDLLTLTECKNLHAGLAGPEEDVLGHIQQLSPENNDLGLLEQRRRRRRDASDIESVAQCRTALTDWLQLHGEQTYYDRLSHALQQIGRVDIAIEVAKNINQAKTLSLEHYVEEYHRHVERLTAEENNAKRHTTSEEGSRQTFTGKGAIRQLRDLTRQHLELVVERGRVPPNPRRLLDGVWPLVYGILLGFSGAFVASVAALLVIVRICGRHPKSSTNRKRRCYRPIRFHEEGDQLIGVMTNSEPATPETTKAPSLTASS